MIGELYDSVLSITKQTGYIERVSQLENSMSLLRWPSNEMFTFHKMDINNPQYTVITFTHDNYFISPFFNLIKSDGTHENIYI